MKINLRAIYFVIYLIISVTLGCSSNGFQSDISDENRKKMAKGKTAVIVYAPITNILYVYEEDMILIKNREYEIVSYRGFWDSEKSLQQVYSDHFDELSIYTEFLKPDYSAYYFEIFNGMFRELGKDKKSTLLFNLKPDRVFFDKLRAYEESEALRQKLASQNFDYFFEIYLTGITVRSPPLAKGALVSSSWTVQISDIKANSHILGSSFSTTHHSYFNSYNIREVERGRLFQLEHGLTEGLKDYLDSHAIFEQIVK